MHHFSFRDWALEFKCLLRRTVFVFVLIHKRLHGSLEMVFDDAHVHDAVWTEETLSLMLPEGLSVLALEPRTALELLSDKLPGTQQKWCMLEDSPRQVWRFSKHLS